MIAMNFSLRNDSYLHVEIKSQSYPMFNFLPQAMSDKIEQLESEMQLKDKVNQLNPICIYIVDIYDI